MSHTIIGLFSDHSQTQRVIAQLEGIGIPSKKIDVSKKHAHGSGVKTEPGQTQEWIGSGNITDNNLTRFFKSLFGSTSDDIPERYTKVAGSGHAIVTVHASSREQAERAAVILDECGAIDVDDAFGKHLLGDHNGEAAGKQDLSSARQTTPPQNLHQPQVGSGSVQSGQERFRSRIIERPVEEHVRLRDEHLHAEQQPVNSPVASNDLTNQQATSRDTSAYHEMPGSRSSGQLAAETGIVKPVADQNEADQYTEQRAAENRNRTTDTSVRGDHTENMENRPPSPGNIGSV